MASFHQEFADFITEFKKARGLDKPKTPRPAAVRRVLTAAEIDAAQRELEMLLLEFDPTYEDCADGAAYEAGKRVADRIQFLRWTLCAV